MGRESSSEAQHEAMLAAAEGKELDQETHEELSSIAEAMQEFASDQVEAAAFYQALAQEAVASGVDEKELKKFEAGYGKIIEKMGDKLDALSQHIQSLEAGGKALGEEVEALKKNIEDLKKMGLASAENLARTKEGELVSKEVEAEELGKDLEKTRAKKETTTRARERVRTTKEKAKEARETMIETKKKMKFMEKAGIPAEVYAGLVDDAVVEKGVNGVMEDLSAFAETLPEKERQDFEALKRSIKSSEGVVESRAKISKMEGLGEGEKEEILREIEEKDAKEKAEQLQKQQREFVTQKHLAELVSSAVASGELSFDQVVEKVAGSLNPAECSNKTAAFLPNEVVALMVERLEPEVLFGDDEAKSFLERRPELWEKRRDWLAQKSGELHAVGGRSKKGQELISELQDAALNKRRYGGPVYASTSIMKNSAKERTLEYAGELLESCDRNIAQTKKFTELLATLRETSLLYDEYNAAASAELALSDQISEGMGGQYQEQFLNIKHPTEENIAAVTEIVAILRGVLEAPKAKELEKAMRTARSKIISKVRANKRTINDVLFDQEHSDKDVISEALPHEVLVGNDRVLRESRLTGEYQKMEVFKDIKSFFETQAGVDEKFAAFKQEMRDDAEAARENIIQEVGSEAEVDAQKLFLLDDYRKEIVDALKKPSKKFGLFGAESVSIRSFDETTGEFGEKEKMSVIAAESFLKTIKFKMDNKRREIENRIDQRGARMVHEANGAARKKLIDFRGQIRDEMGSAARSVHYRDQPTFEDPTKKSKSQYRGAERDERDVRDFFNIGEFSVFSKETKQRFDQVAESLRGW